MKTFAKKDSIKLKMSVEGSDSFGNTIKLTPSWTIILKLSGQPHERMIGKFRVRHRELEYTKHVMEHHMFKKTCAWGINHHIVEAMPNNGVISICVDDTGEKYSISVAKVKRYSKDFEFSEQGFERQLFVPVRMFDDYAC